MNNSSFTSYYQGLTQLAPEEGLEAIRTVNPTIIKDIFASTEAPQALRHMFHSRILELETELPPYCVGRAFLASGELQKAKKAYERAVQQGDIRGKLGLAEICIVQIEKRRNDPKVIEYLKTAFRLCEELFQAQFQDGEIYCELGRLYLLLELFTDEIDFFQKGMECLNLALQYPCLESFKNFAKILLGVQKHLNSEKVEEELQFEAKKGNYLAITYLIYRYKEQEKIFELRQILEQAIQLGYTHFYNDLAALHAQYDNSRAALLYWNLAHKAGYETSPKMLQEEIFGKKAALEKAIPYPESKINDYNLFVQEVILEQIVLEDYEMAEYYLDLAEGFIEIENFLVLTCKLKGIEGMIEYCDYMAPAHPHLHFNLAFAYWYQAKNSISDQKQAESLMAQAVENFISGIKRLKLLDLHNMFFNLIAPDETNEIDAALVVEKFADAQYFMIEVAKANMVAGKILFPPDA